MFIIGLLLGAAIATCCCWYMWHADATQKQVIQDELDALKAKLGQ